jgi:hypothetical protein
MVLRWASFAGRRGLTMRSCATAISLDSRHRQRHTAAMQKPAQVVLAVVLVSLAGVVGWQVLREREREPVYEGKRLSVWLAILSKEWMNGDYKIRDDQPIRQIGTNALPVLIEMLHSQDTRLKQLMMTWANKQKLVQFHFKSAYIRRQDAVLGYTILGPLASPQVPSLIGTLTYAPSPRIRQAVVDALGRIGPEARLAAPALFRATKDMDLGVRNDAFDALGRILPNPELTIPVLVVGLDDPSLFVRDNATISLGNYGPAARAAVPALVRMLATNRASNSEHDENRSALKKIEYDAASSALKKIDPEAAAKAGVE